MATRSRDGFAPAIKDALAKRVAYRCSNPACGAPTTGPHSMPERFVNLGVASHISAAAQRGPRFDAALTSLERSSIDNGVWLCQSCAKLIDNDDVKYTVAVLATWKVEAEAKAMRNLLSTEHFDFLPQPSQAKHAPIPRIGSLTYDEARELLMRAGWQPCMHHWSYVRSADIQGGNGPYFWSKGYHEIRHASGTGYGFCSFIFDDIYNHRLIVVTAGEVIEETDATARVWRWYLEREPGAGVIDA